MPLTVLRRLECVLEPTRQAVLEANQAYKDKGIDMDMVLKNASQNPFYNTSQYNLGNLSPTKTRADLEEYINQFLPNVCIIFEQFSFANTIVKLT